MIKPSFLEATDQPTVIGKVFGAPLVVKGWTGFPLIGFIGWGIFSLMAGHRQPEWSVWKQIFAGAVTSIITLGSEWLHNLAHAAVAGWIGRPVNAIRIFWGTPLLIYYDINDQTVSPRQHLLRAIGGPIFNALIVPLTWFANKLTQPGSLSHYFAGFSLGINLIISVLSLLPIPGLDGGVILKWSQVEKGRSVAEADEQVKKVNGLVGSGLAAASGFAFKRHRTWLGVGFALFAVTSLAIGSGLLKEQK